MIFDDSELIKSLLLVKYENILIQNNKIQYNKLLQSFTFTSKIISHIAYDTRSLFHFIKFL